MVKNEFTIKAIIPQDDTCQIYTIYLYCDTLHILVPIVTNKQAVETLLIAKTIQNPIRPTLLNTFKRVLIALDATVVSVEIYKCLDDIFYAYIVVGNSHTQCHIDARATDALGIAYEFGVGIFVSEEVYCSTGIKITRELIERSISTSN